MIVSRIELMEMSRARPVEVSKTKPVEMSRIQPVKMSRTRPMAHPEPAPTTENTFQNHPRRTETTSDERFSIPDPATTGCQKGAQGETVREIEKPHLPRQGHNHRDR